MIKYPVENYDTLIDNSKVFYPITKHGFWHNGAHLKSNSAAVCNIHTGTVVAMRLTDDYKKTDDKPISAIHALIFEGYENYFTLEDGIYTIKKELTQTDLENGLTEEGKLNALIMIGIAFSNNFVLVKHSAENLYGDSIDFYSLAMHLRPLNKLTFAEKLTLCWYDLTTKNILSVKSGEDTTTISPNTNITLINREFYVNYNADMGIEISFSVGDRTQSGYIYPEFIGDANNITDFNDAVKTTVKEVTLGSITFNLTLKTGITRDAIITPTNLAVATGDIIGYLGVGGSTGDSILPLHYEIFCSKIGFMNTTLTKKIPYSYKVIKEIYVFEKTPTTTVFPNPELLGYAKNLTEEHLEITGEKSFIPGEVFYKLSIIASIRAIEDSYVKIENPANEIERFSLGHYHILKPDYDNTVIKTIYNKNGEEIKTEPINTNVPYLLELPEEGSLLYEPEEGTTVYKIICRYNPSQLADPVSFWINARDLEELVKHSFKDDNDKTCTNATRLSVNDYFLTGSLSADKILKEPKQADISLETTTRLYGETLEDGNNDIDILGGTLLKKMRSGTTSYWVVSSQFDEDKGNFEEIDTSWNEVFRNAGVFNEKYKLSEADLLKIFDDTEISDTLSCVPLNDMIEHHRVMLSKVVHNCPTEWKKEPGHIEAVCGHCQASTKKFITDKLDKLVFWDKVSLGSANWYFHPINFINQLHKVVPINPYIGAKKVTYPAEKGKPALFEVTDSPGFAPVYTSGDEYIADGKSYAHIVGRFNEDYINEGTYNERYTEYYHEGVDLRGPTGTDIHSFIHAKVIAYGWYRGYGKTIILRNLSGIGVYLLGHLSEYMENIDEIMEKPAGKTAEGEVIPAQEGVEVIPGQVVGKTGGSGNYLNSLIPHLHITYYHYEYKEGIDNIFTTSSFIGTSIKQITRNEDNYALLKDRMRDPFNHKTEKIADVAIKK